MKVRFVRSSPNYSMLRPIRKSHPLISIVNGALVDLPAPRNISTWWNIGSLLGLCLGVQIVTGLFLAIHYTPQVSIAFSSVIHIMRDVNYGWLLRSLHANGGSCFFVCLYLHIGRGLYYGSYSYIETWNIGVVIFILVIATAFMGYVLPWGQMRFWGATVITNLFSAIPYAGKIFVEWLWGGFAIDNATLNRFFALHFTLPFVIAAMVVIHLLFLHQTGSNNPLGIPSDSNKVPFHWYFTSKDLTGFLILLFLLSFIVFFAPDSLGAPENFTPANPLVTPTHIKPEWYFLWAYAILRSIPNKLGGVAAIAAAILILFTLPFTILNNSRRIAFYPPLQILFWCIVTTCGILTWIGGQPVEPPFELLGQIFTSAYFTYFFLAPCSVLLWDSSSSP